MGKKLALLPSWYWPEGVPQHIGTPRMYLDEVLVAQHSEERPGATALIAPGLELTYAELRVRVDTMAAGLMRRLSGKGHKVAVAVEDTAQALLTVLAALSARCEVMLVPSRASVPAANLLVVDHDLETPVPRVGPDELLQTAPDSRPDRGPVQVRDVCLHLPAGGGLYALHSHHSLLSGLLSLSTFLGMSAGLAMPVAKPLHTWDGLYQALLPLYLGGTVLLGPAGSSPVATLELAGQRPACLWVDPPGVSMWLDGAGMPTVQRVRKTCRYLLVSVNGPFDVGLRRRLRRRLGIPILTVLGTPETGPVVASHWRWYLDHAVGSPITNGEIRPVDPTTGQWVVVPWELIPHARVAAKGPQMMLRYDGAEATAARMKEKWVLLDLIGSLDANGLLTLLGTVELLRAGD